MRKQGGTPSRRDKHVTLAAISPPGVARGRFVGGHQSGLAGSKPPPLFKRGASSCSSQRQRQREPWGASPRPSAPTYLPTYLPLVPEDDDDVDDHDTRFFLMSSMDDWISLGRFNTPDSHHGIQIASQICSGVRSI